MLPFGPRPTACSRAALVVRMGAPDSDAAQAAELFALAQLDAGAACQLLTNPSATQLLQAITQLQSAAATPWPDGGSEDLTMFLQAQPGVDWAAAAQGLLQLLESAASELACPLLLRVDACGGRFTCAGDGAFTQRLLVHCAGEQQLNAWSWALFKHTFFVSHPDWAATRAAAAAELRGAQWGTGEGFVAVETNATLFPHGFVPEPYHHVLALLHAVAHAAGAGHMLSARTAAMLHDLQALLDDDAAGAGGGWRDFVLRWGLLTLTAAAGAGPGAPQQAPLDVALAAQRQRLLPEVRLPLALLSLAAYGGEHVRSAAAGVLRRLPAARLAHYGVAPQEIAGKPDVEGRAQLAQALLVNQLALCRLPFVAGFIEAAGLGPQLAELAASEEHSEAHLAADAGMHTDELGDGAAAAAAAAAAGLATFSGVDVLQPAPAPAEAEEEQAEAEEQASLVPCFTTAVITHLTIIPPDTASISATDCQSLAQLLPLTSLRALALSSCTLPGDQLSKLSTLHTLRDVSLSFEKPAYAQAAAPALPLIPLRSLTLIGKSKAKFGKRAAQAVFGVLGELVQLTSLHIWGKQSHVRAADFATALRRMTCLRRVEFEFMTPMADGDTGFVHVMRALASLPRLSAIELFAIDSDCTALAGATQLTSLRLVCVHFDTASVAALGSCTGLRSLNAETSYSNLTEACLQYLLGLRQLTQLYLPGLGGGQLQRLQALQLAAGG